MTNNYTSMDQLPITLNADDVANVLGISSLLFCSGPVP